MAFQELMWRKRAITYQPAHRSLDRPGDGRSFECVTHCNHNPLTRPGQASAHHNSPHPSLIKAGSRPGGVAQPLYRTKPLVPPWWRWASREMVVIRSVSVSEHIENPRRKFSTSSTGRSRNGSWNSEFPPGPGPRIPTPPSSKAWPILVKPPLAGPEVNLDQAFAKLPHQGSSSYPPGESGSGAGTTAPRSGMGGWRCLASRLCWLELIKRPKALCMPFGLL